MAEWLMYGPLSMRTQGHCQEPDMAMVWPANLWRLEGRVQQVTLEQLKGR